MEFLRERRLEMARTRLLADAATVADVATDCRPGVTVLIGGRDHLQLERREFIVERSRKLAR